MRQQCQRIGDAAPGLWLLEQSQDIDLVGTGLNALEQRVHIGAGCGLRKIPAPQRHVEGDMLAAGESGSRLNELQPSLYPSKMAQAGKTREQVKEELAEAIHTGDLMAAGEDGRKLNEIYPGQYHQHHAGSKSAHSGQSNGRDL